MDSENKNKNISFFYQCYKQPFACKKAIEQIRTIYKDEEIFLFCDGGDVQHEQIAKSFKNITYEYCERISGLSVGNYPSDTFASRKYLNRMLKAIQQTTAEFIVLIEDDVRIIKKIDMSQVIYDLNGAHNMQYPQNIQNYCKYWLNNKSQMHSGAGGAIIRTAFFRRILNDPLIDVHLNKLFEMRPIPAGCDLILTFLTYVYEGTVGNYPGFCEKNWPDYSYRLSNNLIEVLHQFKDYYL